MELVTGDLKMANTNKLTIKPYKRKIKGKIYKVKSHKRSRRKLGKKITYSDAGIFQVAHDELGNIRGSRVIKPKKKKVKKSISNKIPRKRINKSKIKRSSLDKIDTDYFIGKISQEEWMKARKG
jgi:hypothetical protein